MPPKIKWKVAPERQKYSVWGYKRSWPSAYYQNGRTAAYIWCSMEYLPYHVKTGNHPELTIKFSDWSEPLDRFVWKTLTKKAKTLAEAKQMFADFLKENYRKISPKEYRGTE